MILVGFTEKVKTFLRRGPPTHLIAVTEQAATCDARPSDRLRILAIILSLCGGHATEQANKSGGTLATIQSIHDAAEKTHMFVKDEHHCRRAFLLASHEIVRSGSNGKQEHEKP